MTIAIAAALHNGVVLLADGRRSTKFEVITDTAEKLSTPRDNLAMVALGAETGTNLAEAHMRGLAAVSGHVVVAQLRNLWLLGVSHVISLITPETVHEAHVKVGLVAGGFDDCGAYVAAALFGTGMRVPDVQLLRPSPGTLQFLVLGGEGVGAEGHFQHGVTEMMKRMADADSSEPLSFLLTAAEETAKFASSRDQTIGVDSSFAFIAMANHPNQVSDEVRAAAGFLHAPHCSRWPGSRCRCNWPRASTKSGAWTSSAIAWPTAGASSS